jgi:cytochrome c oxidase subunit 2
MSSNELVLPVDQPILLEMESEDVLHSFWVPEFRVKQDLLPGQPRELRVTPTLIGDYKLRCAEMCGEQHAYMLADVRVLSRDDFDTWVQEQSAAVTELTAEERGEVWYTQFGCNSCHSVDGTVVVGPSWDDLYGSERALESGETVIADEEYLRIAIVDPQAQIVAGFPPVMPANFEEQFAAEEEQYNGDIEIVQDLITYIQTLSEVSADGD